MRKNLILIGLPGSGKTTVGRLTAARLGLSFADCDTLMETAEGMIISAIFDRKGETYFRAAESRILAELCGGSGWVIATGGGTVVEEKNRKIIKRSGFVVFLDRNIGDIARCVGNRERPVLRKCTLEELAAQRRAWYLACADAVVDGKTAEELAEKITELWRNV